MTAGFDPLRDEGEAYARSAARGRRAGCAAAAPRPDPRLRQHDRRGEDGPRRDARGGRRAARRRQPRGYARAPMSTYSKLVDLPVEVESYALEPHELEVSSEFTRLSTVIRMRGGGEEGVGEDVTYDALDHIALQDAGPILPLAGSYSLGELCEKIGGLDLFPSRAGTRGVAALPPLGVRERGARPRAQAGGPLAGRCARARAAAGHVRDVDASSARRRRSSRFESGSSGIRRCASSSTRPATGATS